MSERSASVTKDERHRGRRAWVAGAVVAALALVGGGLWAVRGSDGASARTIAAAASLRNVLPKQLERFRASHPDAGEIQVTYGPSGGLRMQVEGGAPVDGVLFANDRPVERLVERGLVDERSRHVVATNALRLVGPEGAEQLSFDTIDRLEPGQKLAIGDPGAVPAGHYAKLHLQRLGKWEALQPHLVYGGDVAGVLAYARRGEVDAAVVYKTDTIGVADIEVFDEAELTGDQQPVVVQGITRRGDSDATIRRFMEFLRGEEGQSVFEEFGFGPPGDEVAEAQPGHEEP